MILEKKKVLLVTEYLDSPFDEGIKKTAFQVYSMLRERYEIMVICRYGLLGDKRIKTIHTNRLFFSRKLKRIVKKFDPDTIIYLPFASATFASLLRAAVLKATHPSSGHFMIALQPKEMKKWQKALIPLIRPGCVLTPSPELQAELQHMQIESRLIPLLTDMSMFNPLREPSQKKILRKKYCIPTEGFVASHMGHINEGRNLESLIPLQTDNTQLVVVESSSTPKDSKGPDSLRQRLEKAGIIIIKEYIPSIEEIYQLSDLYVFPVIRKTGSIGLPLSILEARACGIPVLTTDFGSVRNMLDDDYGNVYYSTPEDFQKSLREIQNQTGKERSKTKVSELNEQFFHSIIGQIENPH